MTILKLIVISWSYELAHAEVSASVTNMLPSYCLQIFRDFLEPIVMLYVLEQQPQPVTMLFELCQKDGKSVDIRHWTKEDKNITSIYIDRRFVASAYSEQKENVKLQLQRLHFRSCLMNQVKPTQLVNLMGMNVELNKSCMSCMARRNGVNLFTSISFFKI